MSSNASDIDAALRGFVTALQTGDHNQAFAILQDALSRHPDDTRLNNFMGKFLLGAGHDEPGLQHLERAAQAPDATTEHLTDWVMAPLHHTDLEDRETVCRKVLNAAPDNVVIWKRLSEILRAQGKDLEACAVFDEILTRETPTFDVLYNYANARLDLGDYDAAGDLYRRALALNPDHPDSHLHLGFCHLAKGDFTPGWAEIDWRWKTPPFETMRLSTPRWNGERTHGTVLIQAEQGLGDNIHFIRYATMLAPMCARVVATCPPELVRVFQTVSGIDQVVSWDETPPAHDVHIPVMSLPGAFKTTADTIPATVPYIHAIAQDVADWNGILASLPGPKIAIAWQGNPENPRDHLRSIPTDAMMELVRTVNASFICMHKDRPTDIKAWPDNLHHFGARMNDVADSAALLEYVDMIVSADTLLAHLAGALGKTEWIVLGPAPEWRYMQDREDCPWYPNARLKRRNRDETWATFMARLTHELKGCLDGV